MNKTVFAFLFAAFSALAASQEPSAGKPPLKVLMIGNSFSVCVLNQAPGIARELGCPLDITSMYIGGCVLSRHWRNFADQESDPAKGGVYSIASKWASGDPGFPGAAGIPEMLKRAKWDVVTIQQGSHESWDWTRFQPYADDLIAGIRRYAPQAKIMIQQTWSYSKGDRRICDPKTKGPGSWGFDQTGMYERLTANYLRLAKDNGFEVIPTGLAVQKYREFVENDARDCVGNGGDTIHLNWRGEYLQGLVWVGKLFGVDPRDVKNIPSRMKKSDFLLFREAAADALAEPQLGLAVRNRPLAGEWKLALDADRDAKSDAGTIVLPTTTDEAKKGDGRIGGESVERIHPQLVGGDLMNQLTAHATRRFPFVGLAAYEREIELPASWDGLVRKVFLERTKLCRAFIDGVEIGRSVSLTTPAVFSIPADIKSGRHVLRLEIDNRINEVPVSGHQVSEDTQTNWNGVLGRMELIAEEPVSIAKIAPFANLNSVVLRIVLENRGASAAERELRLGLGETASTEKITIPVGGTTIERELEYDRTVNHWSEFDPSLTTAEVWLGNEVRRIRFGVREFGTKGTQFTINGKVAFLRGRHDACVWPLTGYAPMDEGSWRKYFGICREYGLNHVRCHSWCPPEAAFAVADEMGFYLQPEFPSFGGDFENDAKFRAYVLEESKRICDVYGHHPSFVMYTLCNESQSGEPERAKIVSALKAYDPRHLYAQASNADFSTPHQLAGDDFWATFRSCPGYEGNVRGSYAHCDLPLGAVQGPDHGTMDDFSAAVRHSTVPVVGHETGQYQAYPDYSEIAKNSGVLKLVNYEIFKANLEKAGMGSLAKDFCRASGRLMWINYREDMEEAMRTPGFGGFQLLDLQDFPGQGTALVGVLNTLMESKGFCTPEEWRQVCSPRVVMARFPKYTWKEGEKFSAKLQIANYSDSEMWCPVDWKVVTDGARKEIAKGNAKGIETAQGAVGDFEESAEFVLPKTGRPVKYWLEVSAEWGTLRNRYPLWVYPERIENEELKIENGKVARCDDLAMAEKLLAEGKKVLCVLAKDKAPTNAVPGFFASDFWNYRMFSWVCDSVRKERAPGTLGLLIAEKHPALAGFPTDFHSDYQWRNLLLNGANCVLDGDKEAKIIVQGIDNVYRNHRLGVIWEKRRGAGHLVVCSLDLRAASAFPESSALEKSLLDYLERPN